MANAETRLHISPLTPNLISAVLGPILHLAEDISFHQIQTAPENDYGFVSLPAMEAEKLKRRLNGATLRGKKVKIEEARLKKHQASTDEASSDKPATARAGPQVAQSSRAIDHHTLAGHELPSDRRVKRGWTEVKHSKVKNKKDRSKSEQGPSKYSKKEELLFRTRLPTNRQVAKSGGSKTTKRTSDQHTVHEFENSTAQPPFLKVTAPDAVVANLQYVDGQGWVDKQGKVIEPESEKVSRKRKAVSDTSFTTSSRSPRKSVKLNPLSPNNPDSEALQPPEASNTEANGTSSFGSIAGTRSENVTAVSAPRNSKHDEDAVAATDIHPLEALFKKPRKPPTQDIAKPSLEISTSFSFFDRTDDDDNNEDGVNVPGTPFSSQDFRARNLRSAAPTPDTAHPSRFNSYGSTGLPGDEDLEDSDNSTEHPQHNQSGTAMTPLPKRSKGDGEPSEFEKKFWEQRGDNNRAWKARRRTVLKEKRQRENRARRPKNW